MLNTKFNPSDEYNSNAAHCLIESSAPKHDKGDSRVSQSVSIFPIRLFRNHGFPGARIIDLGNDRII